MVSDPDGWADHTSLWTIAALKYAAKCPDDPEVDESLEGAVAAFEKRLRFCCNALGWAFNVLRRLS
jgi:hypothetical protein